MKLEQLLEDEKNRLININNNFIEFWVRYTKDLGDYACCDVADFNLKRIFVCSHPIKSVNDLTKSNNFCVITYDANSSKLLANKGNFYPKKNYGVTFFESTHDYKIDDGSIRLGYSIFETRISATTSTEYDFKTMLGCCVRECVTHLVKYELLKIDK